MNKKEERASFLGAAIFMVLFFFFAVSFAGNVSSRHGFPQQHEQVAVSQVHSINAEAILVSPTPLVHANFDLPVKTPFSIIDNKFRGIAENRETAKRILAIRQVEMSSNPLNRLQFYYHLFSANSRELPALS
ncbi:MAG TPA: hypothetical protein VMV56_11995 [Williamwhitmania sp.]|nr:hypothetical protein [Williamwhitmania sp.]